MGRDWVRLVLSSPVFAYPPGDILGSRVPQGFVTLSKAHTIPSGPKPVGRGMRSGYTGA